MNAEPTRRELTAFRIALAFVQSFSADEARHAVECAIDAHDRVNERSETDG